MSTINGIKTQETTPHIDIVFDGPPGPVCGRFVEVENAEGKSISFGEWVERPDGYWALRLTIPSRADIVEECVHAFKGSFYAGIRATTLAIQALK